MSSEPHLPLDSPLRTFVKEGLPPTMASTYAHGHISGHARTPAQQKAFEQAKSRILRTMNQEQIDAAYWETVKKINTILEDDQKRKAEIEREIHKLKEQRDLERRLFKKQKEEKEKRQATTTSLPMQLSGDEKEVKEEADP